MHKCTWPNWGLGMHYNVPHTLYNSNMRKGIEESQTAIAIEWVELSEKHAVEAKFQVDELRR